MAGDLLQRKWIPEDMSRIKVKIGFLDSIIHSSVCWWRLLEWRSDPQQPATWGVNIAKPIT